MALIDNPQHETITIHSPYATRRLPVQGLFVDVPTEKRDEAIRSWASSMIEQVASWDELRQAKELADTLWEFYNNNDLMFKREQLSVLLSEDPQTDLPADLRNTFEPIRNSKLDRCTQNCFDIRSGDYSPLARRFAALEVILRLLKRCILARKRVEQMHMESDYKSEALLSPDKPIMHAADVFMALFPVPATPLTLFWHKGQALDGSDGWSRSLMDLNDSRNPTTGIKRVGNLALKISDVLSGKDWSLEYKTYGLLPSERHILRCMALSDEELSLEDWQSHLIANQVLRWAEVR